MASNEVDGWVSVCEDEEGSHGADACPHVTLKVSCGPWAPLAGGYGSREVSDWEEERLSLNSRNQAAAAPEDLG